VEVSRFWRKVDEFRRGYDFAAKMETHPFRQSSTTSAANLLFWSRVFENNALIGQFETKITEKLLGCNLKGCLAAKLDGFADQSSHAALRLQEMH
jgi:hypothetical protein